MRILGAQNCELLFAEDKNWQTSLKAPPPREFVNAEIVVSYEKRKYILTETYLLFMFISSP